MTTEEYDKWVLQQFYSPLGKRLTGQRTVRLLLRPGDPIIKPRRALERLVKRGLVCAGSRTAPSLHTSRGPRPTWYMLTAKGKRELSLE